MEDLNWHFITIIFHYSTAVLLKYNFTHQHAGNQKKKYQAVPFSILIIDNVLLGLNCHVTRHLVGLIVCIDHKVRMNIF